MAGQNNSARGFLLFSGYNYRAIVAFCREVESCGLTLCIVALDSSDLIFKTRYKKYVVATRRDHDLQLDDFKRCIQEARVQSGVDTFVICPTSESFNVFILKHRDFLSAHNCEIPLVQLPIYESISNKLSASELCQRHGIKVPRRAQNPDGLPYPFVAKPRKNIDSRNKTLYPYLIFDQCELERFSREEDAAAFYFEEFVQGSSYYLLFYITKSGRVFSFSQENQLQQADGKSIILARGALLHRRPIAQKFVDLLKAVGFYGLAMIEVRGTGEDWTFIEVNPRFWGPLQLLADSGSDMVRAFIGEMIFSDPCRFVSRSERTDAVYFWFNGAMQNIFSGRKLAWHVPPPKFKFWFIVRHVFSDVYSRADTIRAFWVEFFESVLMLRRRKGAK